MSTARIVSLVIAGFAIIAAIALKVRADDIQVLQSFAGNIYIDEDASREREMTATISFLAGLAGFGAVITFIVLTIRDQNRRQTAGDAKESVAADLSNTEDRTS